MDLEQDMLGDAPPRSSPQDHSEKSGSKPLSLPVNTDLVEENERLSRICQSLKDQMSAVKGEMKRRSESHAQDYEAQESIVGELDRERYMRIKAQTKIKSLQQEQVELAKLAADAAAQNQEHLSQRQQLFKSLAFSHASMQRQRSIMTSQSNEVTRILEWKKSGTTREQLERFINAASEGSVANSSNAPHQTTTGKPDTSRSSARQYPVDPRAALLKRSGPAQEREVARHSVEDNTKVAAAPAPAHQTAPRNQTLAPRGSYVRERPLPHNREFRRAAYPRASVVSLASPVPAESSPRAGRFSYPADLLDNRESALAYLLWDKEPKDFANIAQLLYAVTVQDRSGTDVTFHSGERFWVFENSEKLWPAIRYGYADSEYLLIQQDALVLLCPHGHMYNTKYYRAKHSHRPAVNTSKSLSEIIINRGDLLQYAHSECIYENSKPDQQAEIAISRPLDKNRKPGQGVKLDNEEKLYLCVRNDNTLGRGWVSEERTHLLTQINVPQKLCGCIPALPYTGRARLLRDMPEFKLRSGQLIDLAHRADSLNKPAVYCFQVTGGAQRGFIHSKCFVKLRNPVSNPYRLDQEPDLPLTPKIYFMDEKAWVEGEELPVEIAMELYNRHRSTMGKVDFSDEAKAAWEANKMGNNPGFKKWADVTQNYHFRIWRFWKPDRGVPPSGDFYHLPREFAALPAPLADTLPGQSMAPILKHRKQRAWSMIDIRRQGRCKNLQLTSLTIEPLRRGIPAFDQQYQSDEARQDWLFADKDFDDTISEPDQHTIQGKLTGFFPATLPRRYVFEMDNGKPTYYEATTYDANDAVRTWEGQGGGLKKYANNFTYQGDARFRFRAETEHLRRSPFPWGSPYAGMDAKWPTPYGPWLIRKRQLQSEGHRRLNVGAAGEDEYRMQAREFLELLLTNQADHPEIAFNLARELRSARPGYLRAGDYFCVRGFEERADGHLVDSARVVKVWDHAHQKMVSGQPEQLLDLTAIDYRLGVLRTAALRNERQEQVVLINKLPGLNIWTCLRGDEIYLAGDDDMDLEHPQNWQPVRETVPEIIAAQAKLRDQHLEPLRISAPPALEAIPSSRWRFLTQVRRALPVNEDDHIALSVSEGEFVYRIPPLEIDDEVVYCTDAFDEGYGWVNKQAFTPLTATKYIAVLEVESSRILPSGKRVAILDYQRDLIYGACDDGSKGWYYKWHLGIDADDMKIVVCPVEVLIEKGWLHLTDFPGEGWSMDNNSSIQPDRFIDIDEDHSAAQRASDQEASELVSHSSELRLANEEAPTDAELETGRLSDTQGLKMVSTPIEEQASSQSRLVLASEVGQSHNTGDDDDEFLRSRILREMAAEPLERTMMSSRDVTELGGGLALPPSSIRLGEPVQHPDAVNDNPRNMRVDTVEPESSHRQPREEETGSRRPHRTTGRNIDNDRLADTIKDFDMAHLHATKPGSTIGPSLTLAYVDASDGDQNLLTAPKNGAAADAMALSHTRLLRRTFSTTRSKDTVMTGSSEERVQNDRADPRGRATGRNERQLKKPHSPTKLFLPTKFEGSRISRPLVLANSLNDGTFSMSSAPSKSFGSKMTSTIGSTATTSPSSNESLEQEQVLRPQRGRTTQGHDSEEIQFQNYAPRVSESNGHIARPDTEAEKHRNRPATTPNLSCYEQHLLKAVGEGDSDHMNKSHSATIPISDHEKDSVMETCRAFHASAQFTSKFWRQVLRVCLVLINVLYWLSLSGLWLQSYQARCQWLDVNGLNSKILSTNVRGLRGAEHRIWLWEENTWNSR